MICRKHLIEAKGTAIPLIVHQKTSNATNKCINPKYKTALEEKLIRPMSAPMDKLCEILGTKPTVQ